jgi:hypothetical protein
MIFSFLVGKLRLVISFSDFRIIVSLLFYFVSYIILLLVLFLYPGHSFQWKYYVRHKIK